MSYHVSVLLFHGKDSALDVLLVKHGEESRYPFRSVGLPQSPAREGETPRTSAVRVLQETTGLITTSEHLLFLPYVQETKYLLRSGKESTVTVIPLLCRDHRGVLSGGYQTEPFWQRIGELQDQERFLPNVGHIVRSAAAYRSRL